MGDIKTEVERSVRIFPAPGFPAHEVATAVFSVECVHTPCRTRIFLTHFPCVAYKHRVHACLQCACHISPSHPLHSHVSSAVVAVPVRSLRHLVPVSTLFAEMFPFRKRGRTSARAAGSLAAWPIPRTPQQRNASGTAGSKRGMRSAKRWMAGRDVHWSVLG